MNNAQVKAKIVQFETAIRATRRLGVKPPAALVASVMESNHEEDESRIEAESSTCH